MKKFNVETRSKFTVYFENWVGDYIEAETEGEAIELAKAWLVENGYDPEEVEEFEYHVTEHRA